MPDTHPRRHRFTPGMWAGLCLLLAACATEPPAPYRRDTLIEKSATVIGVYMTSRIVEMRGDDGAHLVVNASPEVRNLAQVRVGDRVHVSYYTGLVVELKKPGEGVKGVQESTALVTALPGEKPAAAVGTSLQTSVIIQSVDTALNTVTFKRQDGIVRTLEVQDPEARKMLKDLRPDQEVEVTYLEAVAVQVRPAEGG